MLTILRHAATSRKLRRNFAAINSAVLPRRNRYITELNIIPFALQTDRTGFMRICAAILIFPIDVNRYLTDRSSGVSGMGGGKGVSLWWRSHLQH